MTEPSTETRTAPESVARKRRRLRLSILPTLCTLGNSVCGFLAICYAADASRLLAAAATAADGSAKLAMAGWMLVVGAVFDMLDGRIARLTRSTSTFGGALDSLADVVSFGVAPALIAKTLCQDVLGWHADRVIFATAAFFAACATLRLARYNAEHDEPDEAVTNFQGLPTPGAAAVVIGLAISHERLLRWFDPSEVARVLAAQVVAVGLLIGLGLLMVSRVPYFHFANRFLSGRKPVGRVALLVLLLVLMYATGAPEVVIAGLALAYALSGPVSVLPRLLRRRRDEPEPELFD
jgi:CDP-diacylglycerol--serine O-phosphatidyltransferase